MLVFPAIDLIHGKCVRLTEGNFDQLKEYSADPVDMAKKYQDAGLTHLHLVDLDGAHNKKVTQYKILESIVNKTGLTVDFGGGIQSNEDIRIVFENGAHQANIGSLAVVNPELLFDWIKKYGAEKIILSSDVKYKMIATHAWKDLSTIHLFDLIDQYMEQGLQYLTCTDISKDGRLTGVNEDLYKELQEKYTTLKITASGGVHHINDLRRLKDSGIYGTIVGKAIYENKISLKELYEIQND